MAPYDSLGSRLSPEEEKWYVEFRERAGLEGIEKSILFHASMSMCKEAIEDGRKSKETLYSEVYPKHPSENRKFLLNVLDKVVEGEAFPNLSEC